MNQSIRYIPKKLLLRRQIILTSNIMTIVVPSYNEEDTLEIFMDAILETQKKLPSVFIENIYL